MHGQCLVAVYPTRNEAEQAFRAARGSGIPAHNIRMSGTDADMARPQAWEWLFSRNIPESEKKYYRLQIAEGRTALSVLLDAGASSAKVDAIEEILDRFNPVDVRVGEDDEDDGQTAGAAGRSPAAKKGRAAKKGGAQQQKEHPMHAQHAAPQHPAHQVSHTHQAQAVSHQRSEEDEGVKAASSESHEVREPEEEVIPLPREEARIGIKATDKVRHVRTYVVEEPFEQDVSLSDERLVIERRRIANPNEGEGDISVHEYEFHERHEEPVVEMTIRTDEELVVRTEPSLHTERVQGKARRLEAEVYEGQDDERMVMKGSDDEETRR